MSKEAYATAHHALSALELYSDHFASSQPFVEKKAEIVALLKAQATNKPGTHGSSLLEAMANALEQMR